MQVISTHGHSGWARSGVAVRDALSAVSLVLAAVGVTLQSASAQPVRDTPAGRLVTVPERVLVHLDDGRMEVVTRDILLPAGADAATLVPKSVPVFEVDRDGNLSAGAYARNTTGHPVTYMAFEAPEQIRWEQERGYIVETCQMGVLSTHGSIEDGYTWKMRDHLEVHLTPELDLLRGHQNGENTDSAPFQIAISPDVGAFQLAFPEPEDLVHMNESMERAEARIQDLLVPDDSPKGGYITSVTPTFTWGPDPQNDKWHLTVFEGLTTHPSAIVLAPRNLTTQFYVVPASTPLTDATTYTWLVVGETFAGYVYSESSTFTVCYADCDQSGVLDIFDFLCFQNAFVQGDPYACDCDPDPICDVFDFLCFQNAYVTGCP